MGTKEGLNKKGKLIKPFISYLWLINGYQQMRVKYKDLLDNVELRSLVGTMTDLEVAKVIGISDETVRRIRNELGIAPFCPATENWSVEEVEKLKGLIRKGLTDLEISSEMVRSVQGVTRKRQNLKIISKRIWTQAELRLFEKGLTNKEISIKTGRSLKSVNMKRYFLGLNSPQTWSKEEVELLGTDSDEVIAEQLSRSIRAVKSKRNKLNIKSFKKNI